MSEPTYTYVKGKGWVPIYNDHVVTMRCGKKVRLEARPALEGEYFDSGGISAPSDSPEFWKFWENSFSRLHFHHLVYSNGNSDYECVVAVPL